MIEFPDAVIKSSETRPGSASVYAAVEQYLSAESILIL